ncbi:MAG: hypothetical protein RSG78_00665, partial [Oscillospiraceae bacterium]
MEVFDITKTLVLKNKYIDEIALSKIAYELSKIDGVDSVFAAMATPEKRIKSLSYGFSRAVSEKLKSNDLMFSISSESLNTEGLALDFVSQLERAGDYRKVRYVKSVEYAKTLHEGANLAVVSVPSGHAVREAQKCLRLGMNVMLMSSVSIEDEARLKIEAKERGLVLFGHKCGGGIIDGVPLGFAAPTKNGTVAVVSSSALCVNSLCAYVEAAGGGISQAVHVGKRESMVEINFISTKLFLDMLCKSGTTSSAIVHLRQSEQNKIDEILEYISALNLPVVVLCAGLSETVMAKYPQINFAFSLEEAAFVAVRLAGEQALEIGLPKEKMEELVINCTSGLSARQCFARGFFLSGAMCDEAMRVAEPQLTEIYSNIPIRPINKIYDSKMSKENTFLDFGDSAFEYGTLPHYINQSKRNRRILEESSNKTV